MRFRRTRKHDDDDAADTVDTVVDRRSWDDRTVLACLAIGVACLAFAAGRFSVDQGPKSVQEALQMAQSGELPFSSDGSATGAGGAGFGGGRGTGAGRNAGTGTNDGPDDAVEPSP
jgi:hypothetical protein